MSEVKTDLNNNDFIERFWRIIEKGLGCKVPLYIKNILRLRGFDNAASIRTLSTEDYAAIEQFVQTKMDKYIPKDTNREDYFHLFSSNPTEFEILPGHIRLLDEIVKYVRVKTASHDLTFFDPDLQFGSADNSIGQSQELSDEKLNCELENSVDPAIGRSQLVNTNGKKSNDLTNSASNSIGRCRDHFKSNEKVERQFGDVKPLGQDLFRSNYVLRRCKSNDTEFRRRKYSNFEQLQQRKGDHVTIQALLQNSTNLDSYRSGENCLVTHINSISDFYIQMESDANALDKLAHYLMDAPKFDALTDIQVGIVCAAKFMGDGLWYRAMIKSHTADDTEVFFIDYGNSSLTNELRIIPSEISTAPSLAKHCSMVKPKEVFCWSANDEERFLELCDNTTNFMVEVISHTPDKSIVNLFVNHKSFLEEIACLSAKHSRRSSKCTIQSKSDDVASESVKAFIVYGSPNQFYIHLERNVTKFDELLDSMLAASTWPKLENAVVGEMCAALFEGNYYRATILSLVDEDPIVHFIDYGNKTTSTDLRQLPDNLRNIQPLAILCSLETDNEIFSQQLVERFENLSTDKLFEIKYLSEKSTPAIVQLFENGVQITDKPARISVPNEPTKSSMHETHISENISPSQCHIELDKVLNETKAGSKTVAVDKSESIIDDTKMISTATILEQTKEGEIRQREKASPSPSDGGTPIVSLPEVYEALVRYSELTTNGKEKSPQSQPKEIPYKVSKFIEPLQLIDDDIVVIRYVESPSVFYVQKTKNIPFYNVMMDKLIQHCLTAPSLKTFEIGMACAARYGSDSDWYRAEIEEVNGKDALVRFVDFGNVLTTETNNLKEISNNCMLYTKQAVRCCLFGFDALQNRSTIDRMELLAENACGERRNFRIKIHGHVNDSLLVNLTDESEAPPLDLSKRILQLSLPLDAYRSYERKMVKAKTSLEPINEAVDPSISTREPVNSSGSKFFKNQNNVNQSYDSRHETLSPEGVIDPNSQIPFEEISINKSEEVKLSWCFSPLEFYVSTTKYEADFIKHMDNIHHFYKNKSPATNKIDIGSFVIAKYKKDNQFHRAEIVAYNEDLNKYKARLIDVGVLTILDVSDIYEMDKRFAKFERRVILCSLLGVALRASRLDVESAVAKYFTNKNLLCKFIKRKGDKFLVDIEADGIHVREALIRDEFLSVLSEEIEIERLVGQTVMAKVVSIKDWSSLQLVIFGCETIFEASCKDYKLYSGSKQLEDLPMQATMPVRIDSLLVGQTFSVTPLINNLGAPHSLPICKLPFFSNNFKVLVTYWETHNVAYVQSVSADNFEQLVLTQLFEYYNSNGDELQEFVPETLCAVRSTDENWYRAEIIYVVETAVKVRYLDYGNCEIIPKQFVKRLESQFLETPALAIKVYLPIKEAQSDQEISVDKIDALTSHTSLELTVLDYYAQNWIVDLFQDGASIISFIKRTTGCGTLSIDELKEQLNNITLSRNVTPHQIPQNDHQDEIQSKLNLVDAEVPTIDCSNTSKTRAYISHVDRPDRFYLQVLSESDELELDVLQENIQLAAPLLPPLEDFSAGTRCIVQDIVDGQWYRGVIIDSDSKITSILFIDYGKTDTITDNSMIKSMNETFDGIPAYAIPCALPLEAKDNKWSEESCKLLESSTYEKVEFEYVCKGKYNNFVKIYHGERDFMEELIQSGNAIKLETIKSGENCYVSHVNSISDFYIQMESDTDGLEKLAEYLLDGSKFNVLTDITNDVVCVAKCLGDDLWYRAIILSHTADGTTVFFMDYGNSSLTNEVRIIPPEIANIPSLAKHCSFDKPEDIRFWSENAEDRFVLLTVDEAIFTVDVISPGKKSIVDLFMNKKSIFEEISSLCENDSMKISQNSLQSFTLPSKSIKALIVDGSPALFYIQLERNLNELYQIFELMAPAATWPVLREPVVGQMCAAIFEGAYYRAKIESVNEEGAATVYYIDYGNKSLSTDLRVLPEILQISSPLAIKCCLESNNGIYSPQLVERFDKLTRADYLDIKYVSENSSPAIVQLFENGILFADVPDADANQNGHVKADSNDSIVNEIINEAIEIAESRYLDFE